jgi:hypothetical protein
MIIDKDNRQAGDQWTSQLLKRLNGAGTPQKLSLSPGWVRKKEIKMKKRWPRLRQIIFYLIFVTEAKKAAVDYGDWTRVKISFFFEKKERKKIKH